MSGDIGGRELRRASLHFTRPAGIRVADGLHFHRVALPLSLFVPFNTTLAVPYLAARTWRVSL